MLGIKTKKSRLHAPYDFLFVCWLFCTLFFPESNLIEITQWCQTSPYRLTDLLVPSTWLVVRSVRDKVARKLIRCVLRSFSRPLPHRFLLSPLTLRNTNEKHTDKHMLRRWDRGTNSVEQKRVGLEEEWFYANNKTLNSLNRKVNRYSIFISIMWFNQAGLFSYSISASYSRDVCR